MEKAYGQMSNLDENENPKSVSTSRGPISIRYPDFTAYFDVDADDMEAEVAEYKAFLNLHISQLKGWLKEGGLPFLRDVADNLERCISLVSTEINQAQRTYDKKSELIDSLNDAGVELGLDSTIDRAMKSLSYDPISFHPMSYWYSAQIEELWKGNPRCTLQELVAAEEQALDETLDKIYHGHQDLELAKFRLDLSNDLIWRFVMGKEDHLISLPVDTKETKRRNKAAPKWERYARAIYAYLMVMNDINEELTHLNNPMIDESVLKIFGKSITDKRPTKKVCYDLLKEKPTSSAPALLHSLSEFFREAEDYVQASIKRDILRVRRALT